MPKLSLASSEVIKRRFFRSREHLQCLDIHDKHLPKEVIAGIATATYEVCRGMKLPAVKHERLGAVEMLAFRADALHNLTTLIDYDLTEIDLDAEAAEEAALAAMELMSAVIAIPLPAHP
jgi:hypothetical protein